MNFPIVTIRDIDPQVWGRNARNDPFRIEIARRLSPTQSWLGVLAQERYEWGFKWKRGLIGVLIPGVRREMELRSHTVEAWVAHRWDMHDFDMYLRQEAQSMVAGYDGLFKGMTWNQVYDLMIERKRMATRWTRDHGHWLYRWYDRRPGGGA